ncbi:hypothetical protein C0995_009115 [Termitomyces sp. Mi166|nr:hypothetical protein C0995_009115 [Termitomyces sp. Mi166\
MPSIKNSDIIKQQLNILKANANIQNTSQAMTSTQSPVNEAIKAAALCIKAFVALYNSFIKNNVQSCQEKLPFV